MEKKFTDFSLDKAARMAKTNAGQQLMDLMKQHPDTVNAAESARNGDMEQAKKALEGFISNPQAQALLRQLWEEYHG